ncbi:MAG TPA: hypothetical protein PLB00_08260 [Pseudomonadota bacterium]|jgi:hypothetical protein|nr:hypothetical protein [Pseudomonadota bacterium]
MTTSLLDLALSLLLSTAASIGQPATSVQPGYPAAIETPSRPAAESVLPRRQARAARVSLTDPYYSFSRARRANVKD